MSRLSDDEKMYLSILAIVFMACVTCSLGFMFDCIKHKHAVQNGYTQQLLPGSESPVWVKESK